MFEQVNVSNIRHKHDKHSHFKDSHKQPVNVPDSWELNVAQRCFIQSFAEDDHEQNTNLNII